MVSRMSVAQHPGVQYPTASMTAPGQTETFAGVASHVRFWGKRCYEAEGCGLMPFLIPRLLLLPVGPGLRLGNAAPSVQSHYKTFTPTTGCSAPVLRIGTLALHRTLGPRGQRSRGKIPAGKAQRGERKRTVEEVSKAD